MHQRGIAEVAQGEQFRREVLEVDGNPGHAGQRLIHHRAGGGAFLDGMGTAGLDDAPAPLQVGVNFLRQTVGHRLEGIDQLRRQLMARDPALLGAIAMVAPAFEIGLPGLQPALARGRAGGATASPSCTGFSGPGAKATAMEIKGEREGSTAGARRNMFEANFLTPSPPTADARGERVLNQGGTPRVQALMPYVPVLMGPCPQTMAGAGCRAEGGGRCVGRYRGTGTGDGEEVTSAESASQICHARSGSRRDGPWGFSNGGRDGPGSASCRQARSRGGHELRAGVVWAIDHPSTSASSGAHALTPRPCALSTRIAWGVKTFPSRRYSAIAAPLATTQTGS
jgi:hypothetical protein